MPAYGTLQPPPFLGRHFPMAQQTVFVAEAVVASEYSQQVSIPLTDLGETRAVRVEIDFSANPGNVEIDVMESDVDTGNKITGGLGYQQVSSGNLTQAALASGPNGASTRLAGDFTNWAGQFACLFVKVAPSNASITVTARITRAA